MTDNRFGGRRVVISALTGSHNYNLNTPQSDEDFKFFVMPTFEDLFTGKFFSNAKQSDDFDFDVHDVRQLGNLLWKANINFIEVLFSKRVDFDPMFHFLFDDPDFWATMNIPAFRNATMGMHFQKMSELHKGTAKTQHLVEKFGFDTKQACHAMRCLLVVQKFFETGSMAKALWFPKGEFRTKLLKIKAGEVSESEFMHMVEDWHRRFDRSELDKAFNDSSAEPERKAMLDRWMFDVIKAGVLAQG